MAEDPQWTMLESDPGVFTALISELGAQGVQVEELYELDSSVLPVPRPCYGLILLFKWKKEVAPRATLSEDEYLGQVYFARQTVPNACATQAILSVLFNQPQLHLGEALVNLKAFTLEMPPELKGLSIGNAEDVRRVHNSFSPPHDGSESREATDKDDVYHFVAYVCIQGAIYELDGLQAGPIRLVSSSEEEWVAKVTPYIRERMAQYSANEIRFNLMAVVADQVQAQRRRLAELEKAKAAQEAAKTGREALMHVEDLLSQTRQQLEEEEAKQRRWRDEGRARQFFNAPFIHGLLQAFEHRKQQRRQLGLGIPPQGTPQGTLQ